MSSADTLLQQLRDIHEPLPPEAASPWLLIATAVLGLCTLLYIAWRWQRHRSRHRRYWLSQIAEARHDTDGHGLMRLAQTLRLLARENHEHATTSLSGDAWLSVLDSVFKTEFFTSGNGQVFGTDLYRPDISPDIDALCQRLTTLVRRVRRCPPAPSPPTAIQRHRETDR